MIISNCDYTEKMRNGELFSVTLTPHEGYALKITDNEQTSDVDGIMVIPAKRLDSVLPKVTCDKKEVEEYSDDN